MRLSRFRPRVAIVTSVGVAAAASLLVTWSAQAASAGCQVTYAVTNQWTGGFGASVDIKNLGDAISNWTLTWSFTAGQTITQLWNGSYTQSGTTVTVTNASYNASLATGGTASFGFNGTWTSANPSPTSFVLNGTTCTGTTSGSTATAPAASASAASGQLPSSFTWSSSAALISPKSDSTHSIEGIKDPSVVYYNGKYHVFASTANASGYNMVYLSFTDWAQAGSATQYYLDQSSIGTGYRAAPEVFYFAPQKLWYLVYQNGNAAYSTNDDLSDPTGWSAPKTFYSSMPTTISNNIGSGYWVDMWVICDSTNCYLFSSDDNGHLYRSQTTVSNFPSGMSEPVIAMSDSNKYSLFEASNVYYVSGANKYLLIVEAIGSAGRYFRSWTSSSIGGTWSTLAATESNPFAGASNVTFSGTPWTTSISHGEVVRTVYDQTLTISPCGMQYLYQGVDPSSTASYNSLPWKLGLLTQTNSTC